MFECFPGNARKGQSVNQVVPVKVESIVLVVLRRTYAPIRADR